MDGRYLLVIVLLLNQDLVQSVRPFDGIVCRWMRGYRLNTRVSELYIDGWGE
jgi:hypothetical protein